MRNSNRLLALFTSLVMLCATSTASANAEIADNAGATAINFFWQAPAYSEMTWITRDVVVTKSGEGTYFSIIGNWNPPFYLGVQEYKHPWAGGRNKIAIFSAWDTYEKNDCMTCGPETRPIEGRTVVKDLGPGVYSGGFGYEGTGAQAFMWDFDWKIGDRIRAAVNLRTVSDGTEISAALQLNDSKWRYFGTYKYSKKFSTLEPGYSFIEDFLKTPRTVRAAEYGNTWMESEDLSSRTPINFVQARANTDPNTKYHLIKQLNPTSLWGQVGGDEFISKQEYVPAKIEVSEDLLIPLEARVAALNLSGDAQKNYEEKYLQNKTNREANFKAEKDRALLKEEIKNYGVLDNYAVYFDPDPKDAVGFLTRNRFNYNTKQIRVVKSYPGTDFQINGSYGSTPGFVGGLQETSDGKRQVFITAYHLDENTCKLATCVPRSTQRDWSVEVVSGDLVSKRNDFATHVDLYSSNITWTTGELVTWLTVLSPEKSTSLLSVAIKVGTGAWQHLATIRYPAIYESGLAGGYGGVSEPSTPNPFTSRVVEYSPTVLENFAGTKSVLTNVFLYGPKGKNRHAFVVNSFGLTSEVGIEPQLNTQSEYRVSLRKDSDSPQSVEGQRFVNEVIAKLSPEATQYRLNIETKVKAELELKARQEAEAAAKALAAKKKTTIICVKGKTSKKVTAVKPKCPTGYKKK